MTYKSRGIFVTGKHFSSRRIIENRKRVELAFTPQGETSKW